MTKKRSWFAALAVAFVLPTAFAATTAAAAEVPNGASSQDGSAVVADIIPAALNGSQPLDDHGDSYSVKAGVTTVNLPKDGDQWIRMNSGEYALSIGFEASKDNARISDTGTAASYEHQNGDSSVVNLTTDGGLRITSVVSSAESPNRFSYAYDGVALELFQDGGVVGYAEDGSVAVIVQLPWAYDARGTSVPTWYELEGNTLVQVVDHASGDYTYPIVADPTNYGGNTMYQKISAAPDPAGGDRVSVYVGTYNFSRASNDAIWASYKSLVPAKYEAETMKKQLLCHVRNIGALKSPWNLETRRPNYSDWDFFVNLCNPN